MTIIRYDSSKKSEWDNFVAQAKNSTFLFKRDYMDYHSSRFTDCSLMIYNGNKLSALLPANIKEQQIVSHGGLTYGGLILKSDSHATDVLNMFFEIKKFIKEETDATTFIYKPIPYIYSTLPSQEDLYALFRIGATITSRAISSTISNDTRLPFGELRKRKISLAKKNNLIFEVSNNYKEFWKILSDVLYQSHGCTPVHSIDEIKLLQSRFPNNIKLYTVSKGNNIIGGTVVYETPTVAHFQYIAASYEGKRTGALDGLFSYLIETIYSDKKFIDFGISTENGGTTLNEGLIFQKEGFGSRGVVYDTYEIKL